MNCFKKTWLKIKQATLENDIGYYESQLSFCTEFFEGSLFERKYNRLTDKLDELHAKLKIIDDKLGEKYEN